MTMDGQVPVQPKADAPPAVPTQEQPVNTQEQASPPASTAPPTTPEPLTAEQVKAMIAEATAKAVELAKDVGRRELQSQQDKNRAELAREQRARKRAESVLKTTQESLSKLDPEVAKDLEIARLRAGEQSSSEVEREEAVAKAQQAFHQEFTDGLSQFVTELGIDPKDPRIDWATDSQNYLVAQRRVLASVTKIQKDKVQTIQSGLEKRLKELEEKTKSTVNKEANSVPTTPSGGVVSSSDKDFLAKFASGDLPLSKENLDRYNKIKKSYD